DNADVGNLHAFVGGVVADWNLSPLLDSGLALHADASHRFLTARAIAFKAVTRAVLLDDKRLLGIVVLGVFRLGGCGADRLCRRRTCWLRGLLGFRRGAGRRLGGLIRSLRGLPRRPTRCERSHRAAKK